MLNWIWLAFVLVAVIVGGLTGHFPEMTKGAFETAEAAVMKIALPLIGIWAIWLGIMRLAEQSGLVQLLARALRPLMRILFPDVPGDHPAIGAMVLNMAANMLGLGNAATPLGLRAMEQLERLNPRPGVATNAMCTFLALNTASIQLIPTTAIGILAVAGSANAAAIVPAAFITTVIAATAGVIAAKLLERLPIFAAENRARTEQTAAQRPGVTVAEAPESTLVTAPPPHFLGKCALTLYLLAFALMFVMLAFPQSAELLPWTTEPLPKEMIASSAALQVFYAISILAVPFLLSFFPLYAACRGVKVYEQFVEGAKEAFTTAQRVIPFLVAMLLAISLLRTSGVIKIVTGWLRPALDLVHFPVDLLALVLMRPLSGSASQGIFVELVNNPHLGGPDSLLARMAATIYGSTETTFYVLAVYFGAVAIRQTRHAVAVGLIADTVAVIAAITTCTLLFGGR
jgi:spore maturation protein SpmA